MKSIDFYKELYFREIDRKHQLNNDVNIPIFLLSAIVSIQSFIYSQGIDDSIYIICIIFSSLSCLFGLYSLYFLFKSFSNSFKAHKYKEIANAKSYYDYEITLKKHSPGEAENSFNDHLTKELADCSGCNFEINRKRTEDLAIAKKGIFFAVVFTLLLCITFSISILINMSDEKSKQESSTPKPTSEVQPKGPQSVYIKNSKQIPDRKDDNK
jgi:hypothetical protein